jgi:hypothetical protein
LAFRQIQAEEADDVRTNLLAPNGVLQSLEAVGYFRRVHVRLVHQMPNEDCQRGSALRTAYCYFLDALCVLHFPRHRNDFVLGDPLAFYLLAFRQIQGHHVVHQAEEEAACQMDLAVLCHHHRDDLHPPVDLEEMAMNRTMDALLLGLSNGRRLLVAFLLASSKHFGFVDVKEEEEGIAGQNRQVHDFFRHHCAHCCAHCGFPQMLANQSHVEEGHIQLDDAPPHL